MPIWSNDVPTDPRGPSFPIHRTPPCKPLVAIVTSDDIIGCYTHFYKGRTMPCEGDTCEAHLAGIPYRWHAYMSAWSMLTGLHMVFECTAQAAEKFVEYRKLAGTLRGCRFRATRMNSRSNGRIMIETQTADLSKCQLPIAPDVTRCLAIIWSLAAPDVTTTRREPEKDMPKITATRPPKCLHPDQEIQPSTQLKLAADPDNSPNPTASPATTTPSPTGH